MNEKGYWVIRTYKAGMVGEKIKYWIKGERPTKSVRRLRSDIKKIQQNEASAGKNIARLINANFSPEDYLVGLDYSEEAYASLLNRIERAGIDLCLMEERDALNIIREEAVNDFDNFIRRVKRTLPEGTEVKYIAVTSDINGKTGELVRIHHHIVISGNAIEACKEKWKCGSVDYEHIFDEPDHSGLADYLIKQVRYVPDAKKYKPSRNLVHPEPKDRIVINSSELRTPKNCALLFRSEFKPGRPQYIRYMLPPELLAKKADELDEGGGAYRGV